MQREKILDEVQRQAGLDSTDAAAGAVEATLLTLGERITAGEAADLAAPLPEEFGEALTARSDESPADYSVEEFLDRVGRREESAGLDGEETERHVRAVLYALAESGLENELRVAREQLPNEYAAVFDTDDLEAA